MDFDNVLNFDEKDLTPPNIVIENISQELNSATRGYIYGKIVEYSGKIRSYDENLSYGMATIAQALGGTSMTHDN